MSWTPCKRNVFLRRLRRVAERRRDLPRLEKNSFD